MADNVTLNAGTGGDTVAADDIGGVKHQRVKVEFGVDGAATDVSASDPLPVVVSSALPAGTNAIGKLAANSGVDIGDVDITSVPAPLSTTGNGTAAAAHRVTIASDSTGTVAVTQGTASNLNATVVGTGTFAVQADTELNSAAALADGADAAVSTATVGSVPLLMNATTVDRARAVIAALDSAGTGIQAAGLVGQLDDASTATVTENQFAPVRISSRRALLVEGVSSGTGVTVTQATAGNLNATVVGTGTFAVQADTELNSAAALADGASASITTATVGAVPLLMNATTVDRARAVIGGLDSTGTGIQAAGLVAQLDDASTTTVTENQFAPVRLSSRRALLVEGVASGTDIPVSQGTASSLNATVVGTGTFSIQDSEKVADNGGFTDGTTKVLPAGFIFDETAGTALTENDVAASRIDSKRAQVLVIEDATTRGLRVGAVDETGSSAVDALAIGGGTPHDSVDSGNPLKLGAQAVAHGSNPAAVAAADRTNLYANRHGILFTMGGHPNTISRTVYISDATGAQTDASIAGTINSGTKVVVTALAAVCDKANTVDVAVKVGFGASTIPADSATGANGILMDHKGIAAGSGVVLGNGSGILGVGADGEELRLTCEDPVGGGVSITFSYFTIES